MYVIPQETSRTILLLVINNTNNVSLKMNDLWVTQEPLFIKYYRHIRLQLLFKQQSSLQHSRTSYRQQSDRLTLLDASYASRQDRLTQTVLTSAN